MSHLWTGYSPPSEYITLIFCRDVWHCPPSVFRQQSVEDFMDALTCIGVENEVAKQGK